MGTMERKGVSAEPHPRERRGPYVGRLGSLEQVRLEAARLYREARRGDVAPGDASKLCSILALIATLLRDRELAVLTDRLQALEARPWRV